VFLFTDLSELCLDCPAVADRMNVKKMKRLKKEGTG
jgi:hypothetical protein